MGFILQYRWADRQAWPASGHARWPHLPDLGHNAGVMHIDTSTGRVATARWLESPNSDDRPDDSVPELIVIHGISLPPGDFGSDSIHRLFTNTLDAGAHPYFAGICELRVSAHFLIRRQGELVQYVPVGRRAWHAGSSAFAGRECCNDFSVGIELEGADLVPYTRPQYLRLAELIRCLRAAWPSLQSAPVVGHSDIAPGRKTDPGPAFDWQCLLDLLAAPEPG